MAIFGILVKLGPIGPFCKIVNCALLFGSKCAQWPSYDMENLSVSVKLHPKLSFSI